MTIEQLEQEAYDKFKSVEKAEEYINNQLNQGGNTNDK
jgi:hypothetical protein